MDEEAPAQVEICGFHVDSMFLFLLLLLLSWTLLQAIEKAMAEGGATVALGWAPHCL